MKDTFYFSHDQNARGDEKIIPLLRSHGWGGYGLYWALVEKLYEDHGSIVADFDMLAFDLRTESKLLEAIATKFDLFYMKGGRLRSRSVDRRLAERQARVESARASANARWGNADAMRTHCEPNARKKEKKERKEITAAPAAADRSKELSTIVDKLGISTDPKALDEQLLGLPLQFNFGDIPKGRTIQDIPPSCAQSLLDRAKELRLSFDFIRGLKYRIKIKQDELHPKMRTA